ncbi:MAG: hypothetical protein H6727_09340 [Myxococcales bacterium]|nr:hypothetical protein [Myxococcales bacterium]
MADVQLEYTLKVGYPQIEAVGGAQVGAASGLNADDNLIVTFLANHDCRLSTLTLNFPEGCTVSAKLYSGIDKFLSPVGIEGTYLELIDAVEAIDANGNLSDGIGRTLQRVGRGKLVVSITGDIVGLKRVVVGAVPLGGAR